MLSAYISAFKLNGVYKCEANTFLRILLYILRRVFVPETWNRHIADDNNKILSCLLYFTSGDLWSVFLFWQWPRGDHRIQHQVSAMIWDLVLRFKIPVTWQIAGGVVMTCVWFWTWPISLIQWTLLSRVVCLNHQCLRALCNLTPGFTLICVALFRQCEKYLIGFSRIWAFNHSREGSVCLPRLHVEG